MRLFSLCPACLPFRGATGLPLPQHWNIRSIQGAYPGRDTVPFSGEKHHPTQDLVNFSVLSEVSLGLFSRYLHKSKSV